jgi:hypothetical protein
MSDDCGFCGKKLGEEVLTILEKDIHPECFVCYRCTKPFPNDEFFDENGRIYHEKCLPKGCNTVKELAVTESCATCGKGFAAGATITKVEGQLYHEGCFLCSRCGKAIAGSKYAITHGKPAHSTCLAGAATTGDKAEVKEFDADATCTQCGKPLQGQKKVVPGFGEFHLTCFKCSKCGLGISEDFYKGADGRQVCKRCK